LEKERKKKKRRTEQRRKAKKGGQGKETEDFVPGKEEEKTQSKKNKNEN
jgi:hypothetical protein